MQTPKEKLEATAAELARWRQAKKHINSAVPEPLRQQVIALLEHFSISVLKQALNLSNGVFYRWKNKLGQAVVQPEAVQATVVEQPAQFITLPQAEPIISGNLLLEVSVGEQCQIRLSGAISVQQLDVLSKNIFMSQNGSCV